MGKTAYSPCVSGAVMLSNVQGNAYVTAGKRGALQGQGDWRSPSPIVLSRLWIRERA